MAPLQWYIDFLSPFAYLQSESFGRLPAERRIEPKPILLAALLNHWGQLGPAEIPHKRNFTYRHCLWMAQRDGIPMRLPDEHPFNPLRALRLATYLGNDMAAVKAIFRFLWRDGGCLSDDEAFLALGRTLGVDDALAVVARPEVKDALKATTQEAIERKVFGVPTFYVDGRLFWGYDATAMVADYLSEPARFETEAFRRVENLPIGASRV